MKDANGKMNGLGKLYFYNGNLLYEGQYLNRKRNGQGKQYNINGDLIFEGEYLHGRKRGKFKKHFYLKKQNQII